MINLKLSRDGLSAAARRLSDHLAERRQAELKHTHALDALAAGLGYRNRQEMSAAARSGDGGTDAPQTGTAPAKSRITVHVIDIGHRHGTDILVGASRDEVMGQLADYVDENWSEIDDLLPEGTPDSEEMDRDRAIETYFAATEDESWEISTRTLEVTLPGASAGPVRDAGSAVPPLKQALDAGIAGITGPWREQDRVRAMEQGYALEEIDGGRIVIVALAAPEIGDVRHDSDAEADLHVRTLAGRGDATALKALRLAQGFGLDRQQETGTPVELYSCDNCSFHAPWAAMRPVRDIHQRCEPGGAYTDRECPHCGALAFPDER
mgnify:FL=1